MKVFPYLIFYCAINCLVINTLFAQQVPIQKKTKIVTFDNHIYITRNWVIKNDTLMFEKSDGTYNIGFKEIKSISVKQGSTFPLVMSGAIATSMLTTYTNPNISKGHKFRLGFFGGIVVGLIVAPFVQSPLKPVYYDGKWKDIKYKPK